MGLCWASKRQSLLARWQSPSYITYRSEGSLVVFYWLQLSQRIEVFQLRCWRRLLKVPWTARRSNRSILREINPEHLLEELMLKLKLQYFDHLIWTADSLEKSLMLGKIEGRRRKGHQRRRWLCGITDAMDMNLGKLRRWWGTGRPGLLQSMGSQRVGHDWAPEQQQQLSQTPCPLLSRGVRVCPSLLSTAEWIHEAWNVIQWDTLLQGEWANSASCNNMEKYPNTVWSERSQTPMSDGETGRKGA